MTKSNSEDNGYYLPNSIEISSERAKLYFSRRKYLLTLIKTIHSNISYNSQSYFLSIFLMDIIFLKENLLKEFYAFFPSKIPSNDIKLNNYILLSLGCLIISYKFNGNNSMLYPLNNIIKIIHYISGEKFGFTVRDLAVGEACIIKLLKYKLNFYSVYHYLVFFFSHGIIFKKKLEKYKLIEKKVLEKIYIQARQILDYLIDQNKYFELYNGQQNYLIACQIIQWASEKVLNIKIKNSENIFKVIYNINITDLQKKKFLEIIEEKNKAKKIIKTKMNITKTYQNTQYIYNSPQIQMPNNNIYSNVNSEYSYTSQINQNNNNNLYNNNNILTTRPKNLDNKNIDNIIQQSNTNNESIKPIKREPLDSSRNERGKKQECKIISLKKDKNNNNDKSISLTQGGDSISFIFDSQYNEYKSSSNDYRILKFNNELKRKESFKESKTSEKKSSKNDDSQKVLDSSYIFYRNTYNTINAFNDNKNLDKDSENPKVHKGKGDEPRDSVSKNRRITSKMMKREIYKKINNNANQSNTIIINNNMQINTFINNDINNYNINPSINGTDLLNFANIEKVNIQPQIINIFRNEK